MPDREPADLLGPIYDTALCPGSWPDVLARLARLFDCHFADVFARTEDRSAFHGQAIGLDPDDYQREFLGTWTRRNIWGARRPVRYAGEVVTTPEIIANSELVRSEMFNDYLNPRDLHQGLRLATWSGEGWINYISLMRSWSAGTFTAAELSAARFLTPHLERAASVARQLAASSGPAGPGAPLLDSLDQPAILVDAAGRVVRLNRLAEGLAMQGDTLLVRQGAVTGATPADTGALLAAIAAAALPGPAAATVTLAHPRTGRRQAVSVLPVSARVAWPVPDAGAVLLLLPRAEAGPSPPEALRARYGLTAAEAAVALHLREGASPAAISDATGRSIHTVRSHLAHLMHKTGTSRQGDLVRLLLASG